MRDIVATAAATEGKIPKRYNLSVEELEELHKLIMEGKEIEAVLIAFRYGFELGRRATKKGKV